MNFIQLGSEEPDYNHPLIARYNSCNENLDDIEQLIKTIDILSSKTFRPNMQMLHAYYSQKMESINTLFNMYLSDVATINLPNSGFGIWIALNTPTKIGSILPELKSLKLYNDTENTYFDATKPINGIRLGFGHYELDTFENAFKCLSLHLK